MKRSLLMFFFWGCGLLVIAQTQPLRMMSQIPLARALDARCLLFDSYGMMWIGTEQGLLRYDGYSFHNFRSDAYSPGILPNNYVRTLTEDHDKGIWIGTHNGLVRFDMHTESSAPIIWRKNNDAVSTRSSLRATVPFG